MTSITGLLKGVSAVDRRIKAAAALCAALAFFAATYGVTARAEKAVLVKKDEVRRFDALKEEFVREQRAAEPVEKRLVAAAPNTSASAVMDEISGRLGIKSNVSAYKPVEEGTDKRWNRSGVEVKIDGLTLNQTINLLYMIDTHPSLLLVKDFSLKARFDQPELMDVTMQAVLVSKAHE